MPALALPAVAALPSKPTRIAKLWAEYKDAQREYRKLSAIIEAKERAFELTLPEPHPLIANTPENLKLGIKQHSSDVFRQNIRWHQFVSLGANSERTLHCHAGDQAMAAQRGDQDYKPFWTEEQIAEHQANCDELRPRVALAQEYDKERSRLLEETDIPALHQELEDWSEYEGRPMTLIERSRPRTRGDIEIKLALIKENHFEYDERSYLFDDLKHLLAKPSILTA